MSIPLRPVCAKQRGRKQRGRDLLRNGIYELRVGREGMKFRILYFFHGRVAAVLAHGIVKEREVPAKNIERALERKQLFEQDPAEHTYREK